MRPAPASLPPNVRRLLMELAADVLSTLTITEVPARLRKVHGFAPQRRARAGAVPLALALAADETFRRQVAAAWHTAHPELAAHLDDGSPVSTLAPELVIAGLYLIRPEGWEAELERWLVVALAEETLDKPAQARPAERERTDLLEETVAQARTQADAAEAARVELAQELATVRREQRRLRSEADRAKTAAREAERRAVEEIERLSALLIERDSMLRQAERQAQEATDQLASTRRSAKDGRSLAELRARLLLDTIVESASALRRELALPPAARTPADLIADQLTPPSGTSAPMVAPRGLAADDPNLLAELLRIPRAHLIVDGYNVTMEGYGTLPLVDQRRLLIDALSPLAARTSAEVTCCFDGAEVSGRSAELIRGVRVLFSDPGTTADQLIGRLVRAEPPGRMLVVVSSDREVADAAVAAAARSVPSVTLLRLFGAASHDRKRR